MKIQYKYYEPDAGLEEIQAEIYNTALKKYNGERATADQIKERYQADEFDPKGVCYAFDEQGKALAYIQTRKTPNFVYIGYPWAISSTTEVQNAQNQMFDEMLEYVKKKNPDKEIVLGNLQSHWNEPLEFTRKRKLSVKNHTKRYSFTIKDLAKVKTSNFTSRIATEADVPALVKLTDKEPAYETTFASKEAASNYFKGCVERGETMLVFDENNELVSAGATNGNADNNTLFLQFTVSDVKRIEAWQTVLVELANFYYKKGLSDYEFVITPDLEPDQVKFYEENGAKKYSESYLFKVA